MIIDSDNTIQQILPVYTGVIKPLYGPNNGKFLKSYKEIRGSSLYHLSMLWQRF